MLQMSFYMQMLKQHSILELYILRYFWMFSEYSKTSSNI